MTIKSTRKTVLTLGQVSTAQNAHFECSLECSPECSLWAKSLKSHKRQCSLECSHGAQFHLVSTRAPLYRGAQCSVLMSSIIEPIIRVDKMLGRFSKGTGNRAAYYGQTASPMCIYRDILEFQKFWSDLIYPEKSRRPGHDDVHD